MDKMREEFEAWADSIYRCDFSKSHDGEYSDYKIKAMYMTWKASRAAICVELPTKINDDNDARSYGYDSAITDVEMAIEKAGVSYK